MVDACFTRRFGELTGDDPFPWQESLFHRFVRGDVVRSLDIPTGLGKTSVMAIWLLARAEGVKIPRRLVYIVDRRAVVDQATEVAVGLRKAVGENSELGSSLKLNGRPLLISTLRGQHVDNREWLEDPSLPAIIVGTVDMIGSRLLFEGYGVSRKMRPFHAGLLGADSLFILDEAHLVPPFEHLLGAIASDTVGVAPRDEEAREVVPPFKLVSLSATGRTSTSNSHSLTKHDLDHSVVAKRLGAKKRLELKPLPIEGEPTQTELDEQLGHCLAEEAWRMTECGTKAARMIVFCNKRKVAEMARKSLVKLAREAGQKDIDERTDLFVGGRRVQEREVAAERLRELGFIAGSKAPPGPAFVFATSAGEVGVDLDADHMVSDLVEWERMVQRLGRVNRRGDGDARVVVLIRPPHSKDKPPPTSVEARRAALDLLPRYDDGTRDASPGAIRDLKTRAASEKAVQDTLDEATTPEPLRPALTRAVIEAWSMTSLEEHTGRPEVAPWLRGWVEDEPQTAVVWRTHLPVREQGKVTKKEIETFFEAAPVHTSEVLETENHSVFDWLKKRATATLKRWDEDRREAERKRAIGFILSQAGDLKGTLYISEDGFKHLPAGRGKREEDADKYSIQNATLILDATLAGLRCGLLDSSCNEFPQTADDGREWLTSDEGPVIRFRIRTVDAVEPGPADSQWRTRFSFPTTFSAEGEPVSRLVIEKWRSDSTTEEDRAVGNYQLLEDHQQRAAALARKLAVRLDLPVPYAKMLAIAARLHDEGKRASRWQRAFNAPDGGKPYAKTPGPINFAILNGYRHEFGSLEVAARDAEFRQLCEPLQELALHLIAAHHGYARPIIGVTGCDAPPSKLEARAREVALRFARLQRRWGPWGLAWWESLLRAVDHQASRENDAVADGQEAAR